MTGRVEASLPLAVTWLMKGVVYRDRDPAVWQHVLALRSQVQDHVAVMGLVAVAVVDESEGYAFLRQRPDPDDGEDAPALPRLVARRSLSFPLSLLLALLRKKLAEADASSPDSRLVLTRDQVVELLAVFLPSGRSEARVVDQVDTLVGKAVELGFLRRVGEQPPEYEVRRILKAFVDAQWLADFDERLGAYAAALRDETTVP